MAAAAKTARTWIVVHDGMPEHGKIEALSDRGFRALITLWCWCSRQLTDGHVPKAVWEKRATAAVRRELLAAKLVDPLPGGDVVMHDYLDWQRSSSVVAAASEKKQSAARLGNHNRWHVKERRFDPACEHCTSRKPGASVIADAIDGDPVDNSTPDGYVSASSDEFPPQPSVVGPANSSRGPVRSRDDSAQPQADPMRSSTAQSGPEQGRYGERYIADAIADASQPDGSTENGLTPKRRGEERREGLGRGGTSGSEREKLINGPRPRCPKHAELPPDQRVPNCTACMELRVEAEQQAADQAKQAADERRDRRAAIDACRLCDDRGMREVGDALARCNHPTLEAVS